MNTRMSGEAITGSVTFKMVPSLDAPETRPASSNAWSMLRNAGVNRITL